MSQPGVATSEGKMQGLLQEKLGQNLALSHLSELPELPAQGVEEYKLEQHEYAMHLDSAMLTYTPAPGKLKHADPQQHNRFDDAKGTKRKIYVNKDVLARLVCVAEELNMAQAQIEIRKVIKRENRRLLEEGTWKERHQGGVDAGALDELLTGLEVEPDTSAAEEGSVQGAARPSKVSTTKRVPSAYRQNNKVRYPSVLNATAPKDRWGYFRALQRLIPAANNMRPGHIAFGSGVSQHHMGGAAVKAAKAMQREADRQAELVMQAEAAVAAAAAAAAGGDPLAVADAAAAMNSTIAAAMHAHEIREAKREVARQMAEDEGLPTETWWDIMQKRKKTVYFRKLLEEMAGRMDLLKAHCAARTIQKAWRIHRRVRTRKASEEIALLQKELAQRRAMEMALRAAAEAAIREAQEKERAKKKAARPRTARINAPEGSGEIDGGLASRSNGTFSRATSGRGLGWQTSLRGAIPPTLSRSASRAVSRSVSRSVSRAASMRRLNAEEDEDDPAGGYSAQQNNLWTKIQALIGQDWDVDGDDDDSSSEDEGLPPGPPDEESEEEEDDEDDEERRARLRKERNEARRAKKAAAAEAAAAAAAAKPKKGKKKKGGVEAPPVKNPFQLFLGGQMAQVVKQAVKAAKAMEKEEQKKKKKKVRASKSVELPSTETGEVGPRTPRTPRTGGNQTGSGAAAATSPKHKSKKQRAREAEEAMVAEAAASMNVTVEAYKDMRRRQAEKAVERAKAAKEQAAQDEAAEMTEEELHRLEEEARNELMQKAVTAAVQKAAAAAAAAQAAAMKAAVEARAAAMADAAAASAALMRDAAAAAEAEGKDPEAAMAAVQTAAAAAGGGGRGAASVPALMVQEGVNAAEAAAAFAAAAAPTLKISNDDVQALIKDKLRARRAARQATEPEPPAPAPDDVVFVGGDEDDEDDDDDASSRSSYLTSEPDEEDEWEYEEESEDDGAGGRRKKLVKKAKAPKPKKDVSQRTSSRAGGQAGGRKKNRRRAARSDSEYDTMSEDEIKNAGEGTLQMIRRQKERSRKQLQGYFSRRLTAKAAAAAAVEQAMREERREVRLQQRAALALQPGAGFGRPRNVPAGPAWRPGGGQNKRQQAAAAACADNDAYPSHRTPPSDRGGGTLVTPKKREMAQGYGSWGAPYKPSPRDTGSQMDTGRRQRALYSDDGSDGDGTPPAEAGTVAAAFNLSPGGPSLLYRPPPQRTTVRRAVEKQSVRRATWYKGADMPNAVFTQYGWVAGPAADNQHVDPNAAPALDALHLQVASLQGPQLMHALQAFCSRMGMGQAPTSVQQGPSSTAAWTQHVSSDAASMGFHIRSAASANGPSPDAFARQHPHPDAAYYGAGGPAGFGQGGAGAATGHLIMPHPPSHGTASRAGISRHGSGGPAAYVAGSYISGAASPAPGASHGDLLAPVGAASGVSRSASPTPGGAAGGGGGHLATGAAFHRSPMHGAAMAVGGEAMAGAGAPGSLLDSRAASIATAGARTMAAAGQGALAHGGAILLHSSGRPLHAQALHHQAMAAAGAGAGVGSGAASRHTSFGPGQVAAEAAGAAALEEAALEEAAVEGASLQVALAVLRTGSVKPSVARRLYPLGRPRVMDIPVPGYFGISESDPAVGPLSFPLEDLSSSSSEDEDGRSWATASEDGGEEGVAAAGAAADGGALPPGSGGQADVGSQSRGAAVGSRSGHSAAAMSSAATAAVPGGPGSRLGAAAGPTVGSVATASAAGAAAGEAHLQQSPRAARGVLSAAAASQPGPHSGTGSVAATGRAVPPQLGVAGVGPAAAAAGKQPHAAAPPPVQAPTSHQRVTVKAGMHRASPAPPLPHSTSAASTSAPPSRATTAAAALGSGSFTGNASGVRRDLGGAASPSSFHPRPETALSSAWDDDPNLAAGPPAMLPPPDDEPLYDDSEELRQFDMLYDMTRWTVAPPPTPCGYRPEDHYVAVTIRRSEAAKQRDQQERIAETRQRVLGGYASVYTRSLGAAYSRVRYRRHQARAMAAITAARMPTAGGGFGGGARGFVIRGPAARPTVGGLAGNRLTLMPRPALPRAYVAAGGFMRPPRARAGFGASAGHLSPTFGEGVRGYSRSKSQVRVRGTTASVGAGFGSSYYWRRPVKLGSVIRVRPAGLSSSGAATGPALPAAAEPGSEVASGPFVTGAAATAAASALTSGAASRSRTPAPPEVADMATKAIQLLSELGSEIGNLEEQIQALQRKADLEQERELRAGGASIGGGHPQQHPQQGHLHGHGGRHATYAPDLQGLQQQVVTGTGVGHLQQRPQAAAATSPRQARQQASPQHQHQQPSAASSPQLNPYLAQHQQHQRNRQAYNLLSQSPGYRTALTPPTGITGTSLSRVPHPPHPHAAAAAAVSPSVRTAHATPAGATPSPGVTPVAHASGGQAASVVAAYGVGSGSASGSLANGLVAGSPAARASVMRRRSTAGGMSQPAATAATGTSASGGVTKAAAGHPRQAAAGAGSTAPLSANAGVTAVTHPLRRSVDGGAAAEPISPASGALPLLLPRRSSSGLSPRGSLLDTLDPELRTLTSFGARGTAAGSPMPAALGASVAAADAVATLGVNVPAADVELPEGLPPLEMAMSPQESPFGTKAEALGRLAVAEEQLTRSGSGSVHGRSSPRAPPSPPAAQSPVMLAGGRIASRNTSLSGVATIDAGPGTVVGASPRTVPTSQPSQAWAPSPDPDAVVVPVPATGPTNAPSPVGQYGGLRPAGNLGGHLRSGARAGAASPRSDSPTPPPMTPALAPASHLFPTLAGGSALRPTSGPGIALATGARATSLSLPISPLAAAVQQQQQQLHASHTLQQARVLHQQGSGGHGVPPSSPLSAWVNGGATSPTQHLPDIMAPSSPARSALSYSAGGRHAVGPGTAGGAASPSLQAMRLSLQSQPAGGQNQGGPHSPHRHYPKMEVGLSAVSGPLGAKSRRRGSIDGPLLQYYSVSSSGGVGPVAAGYGESHDGFSGSVGAGAGFSAVDALLLNISADRVGMPAHDAVTDRHGYSVTAQRATGAAAAGARRAPRVSEADALNAGIGMPGVPGGIAGSNQRFARVHRMSAGPSPPKLGAVAGGGGSGGTVSAGNSGPLPLLGQGQEA